MPVLASNHRPTPYTGNSDFYSIEEHIRAPRTSHAYENEKEPRYYDILASIQCKINEVSSSGQLVSIPKRDSSPPYPHVSSAINTLTTEAINLLLIRAGSHVTEFDSGVSIVIGH